MLKPKTGICIDCTDGKEKLLYSKERCKPHYWIYRASLKPKKEPKPRKPIRKVSPKQRKRKKEYSDAAPAFFDRLAQRQGEPVALCEIRLPGCTNYATTRHHKEGRIGDLMNDETKQIGCCLNCHRWAEENPAAAIKEGYSLSRIKINQ